MALTAGSLSQVSVTDIGASLLATAAVSGTTPYSYQWYRASVSGFTPGSVSSLAGKTTLAITDGGLSPVSVYYYKVVATDSNATPQLATYSQLSVTTLAAPGNNLSLANIINVSVATPQAGVGQYNTSNLAIFSSDAYDSDSFGDLGYKIYLSPTEVADDFGTSSNTYAMANAVFSQQPNILAGGGYLVVIPFVVAIQNLAFSAVPVSGQYVLNFGGNATAAILYSDTAAQIQAKINAVSGLEQAIVTGTAAASSIQVKLFGYYGAAALMTVTGNTLNGSISVTVSTNQAGETMAEAITRTVGLVQYFGVIETEIFSQVDVLAAAAVIQALNKIIFFVSITEADVAVGGTLALLASGGFTQSRGLFYGDELATALVFMASYAGLGLSTDFNGSLTTQTMHMKSLSGVQADPSMNQTLLVLCKAAGADVYASFQGVAKVYCTGANDFFDNQYNLRWFAGALEVAGFNALATTNTKVPQTENGMNILKGAYRAVCEQAITNGFLAPGAWTSSTTFGNQANLLLNILQRGYYIYSTPVSQQLPAVRVTRAAPLVQIAAKYAGAIQSSTVIVNVNP